MQDSDTARWPTGSALGLGRGALEDLALEEQARWHAAARAERALKMRGIEERRHNTHLDKLLASRLAQARECPVCGAQCD